MNGRQTAGVHHDDLVSRSISPSRVSTRRCAGRGCRARRPAAALADDDVLGSISRIRGWGRAIAGLAASARHQHGIMNLGSRRSRCLDAGYGDATDSLPACAQMALTSPAGVVDAEKALLLMAWAGTGGTCRGAAKLRARPGPSGPRNTRSCRPAGSRRSREADAALGRRHSLAFVLKRRSCRSCLEDGFLAAAVRAR